MFPRLRDHWLTMDPRSAGLFRVTIGCVWLLHLADRWALREDFYSPRGVLPSSLLAASREIPNFPTIFTALESHAWGSGLFFGVAFLAAAALTAGLFTRGSALLSLFAFSTLAHRNPYVLIAGDYVLGSMLLWLTVLRAGKRPHVAEFGLPDARDEAVSAAQHVGVAEVLSRDELPVDPHVHARTRDVDAQTAPGICGRPHGVFSPNLGRPRADERHQIDGPLGKEDQGLK